MSELTAKEIAQIGMNQSVLISELSAKRVSLANVPMSEGDISAFNNLNKSKFAEFLDSNLLIPNTGLDILQSEYLKAKTKRVFKPESLAADKNGFVSYLDVDIAAEMVKLAMAKRAFEANIKVYNNASSMSSSALKIGK